MQNFGYQKPIDFCILNCSFHFSIWTPRNNLASDHSLEIVVFLNKYLIISMRGGRNVEFHYYDRPFFSLHWKWLFSWSLLWHHYIKSPFLVDHYYDTYDVLILPMASKKITPLKIKNIFLSNYLWHITYGYQGLWGPGGGLG